MRVIAGTAKGHKLKAPKSDRVRPALDKIKGAIFNILYNVDGMRVLDLFAGTGSVGIEALSRGASHAVFIEEWEGALKYIQENLTHCKLEGHADVFRAKVDDAINKLNKKNESFDLIFVDPPYLKNFVNPTLKLLSKSNLLRPDTQIIVEHHPKEPIEEIEGLTLTQTRKYGQTLISFLKRNI